MFAHDKRSKASFRQDTELTKNNTTIYSG